MAPRRTRPDRNVVVVQSVLAVENLHHAYTQEQMVTASVSFDVTSR